ncbi:YcxB family protein [Candidatus Gracilibacteria bacterium]|nr:YcxB family protein [Candidatus Gracilibacteria bacterium]
MLAPISGLREWSTIIAVIVAFLVYVLYPRFMRQLRIRRSARGLLRIFPPGQSAVEIRPDMLLWTIGGQEVLIPWDRVATIKEQGGEVLIAFASTEAWRGLMVPKSAFSDGAASGFVRAAEEAKAAARANPGVGAELTSLLERAGALASQVIIVVRSRVRSGAGACPDSG